MGSHDCLIAAEPHKQPILVTGDKKVRNQKTKKSKNEYQKIELIVFVGRGSLFFGYGSLFLAAGVSREFLGVMVIMFSRENVANIFW